MSNYSKCSQWMDIYIEEYRNTILIKERWKYNWLNEPGTSPWTYIEKKNFHNKCDKLIWNIWGNYFDLEAIGDSDFVKRNKNKLFHVNFDIEWVLSNPHWTVNVLKRKDDVFYRSNVSWESRTIKLASKDYMAVERVDSRGPHSQYTVAHEFGHAVGNTGYFQGMHADEYKKKSEFFNDKSSMMNIGNELRERHLDYIMANLCVIIPNTSFKHATWY